MTALQTDVIIVAAGSSTRMGKPKQWLELCGTPVLGHALRAFDRVAEVGRLVIVARTEDIPRILQLAEELAIQKPLTVVEGGATRQQSVAAGVHSLVDSEAPLLAIHDGARPLATPEMIRRVIEAAAEYGAAAAAVPMKDTVKQVDEFGFVTATPPRHTLRAVQTPQIFETIAYRRALQKAAEEGRDYTDDCQLMEAAGARVRLVMGEESNLKITTPADMLLAECFVKQQEEALA